MASIGAGAGPGAEVNMVPAVAVEGSKTRVKKSPVGAPPAM